MSFIDCESRDQISLLPACVDDYLATDALVRVVDAFVASLDLSELGFNRVIAGATGRPGYQPGDMLRLYILGLPQPGSIVAPLGKGLCPRPRSAVANAPFGSRLQNHRRVPTRQSGSDRPDQRHDGLWAASASSGSTQLQSALIDSPDFRVSRQCSEGRRQEEDGGRAEAQCSGA